MTTRNFDLRSVPMATFESLGNVWLITGPGWRQHFHWRFQHSLEHRYDTYWLGMGDLGHKIPPSGILQGKTDIRKLKKSWLESSSQSRRILFVEDPQGAGVWSELTGSTDWIEFLANSHDGHYDVVIGTGVPLPMSRLVLENTDYCMIRCAGEENVHFITNSSRLTEWLDAIGRDIFDDIRIYRKIVSILGTKNRDLVISLTAETEFLPERIFWWDRNVHEHIGQMDTDEKVNIESGFPTSYSQEAIKIKLNTIIHLLQEIVKDL
jgi:hypothetical protein